MAQDLTEKAEEQKRRTERVLLRIPIRVKGNTAEGKPFEEKTITLVVNRDGARISLKNPLRVDDRITITNLQNQMSCPFRVVARTAKSLGEAPEWGVECLEPEVNFWGILFPKKREARPEQDQVDALLECSECRFRELAQLSLDQYRGLASRGSISRACGECKATTEWKYGFAEAEPEEVPALLPAPKPSAAAASGIERRIAKRLTVKLPLRVRLPDGCEEITRTENLSKTGVCFISAQAIGEGDLIMLTVGYAPGSSAPEISARVVWRRPLEGQKHAVYGVHLKDVA